MNLFKIYIPVLVVLILCTVSTGGSLIIPLLLKLIALKGALFIGTPIALGAFLVGQGVGFFGGGLAGGYAVLKAAQKYHTKEKAKWKSPPVKTHFKGHGWNGWQSPKFTKGYGKGWGVGNVIAQLVNHNQKYLPSYHDHYDDEGGYYESSYGYTAGASPAQYGAPSNAYGHPAAPSPGYGAPAPAYGYGGYASPSYSAPDYSHPKEPSFVDRLMSRLPSFLGGKSKDDVPGTSYGHIGPFGVADPSFASADFDPSGGAVPNYAPYPGAPGHLPGQTFAPPTPDGVKYAFSPYDQQQKGTGGSETLFEDSEYTYSSSPYSKPQPKRPGSESEQGQYETYPGGAESYDGPAKEYTGVMTDYFQAIQNMKQKPYGNPLGSPMGPGEYTHSASPSNPHEYATSSSNKDEQILNLASSLHKYAAAQRRKDTGVKVSKSKITPSYVVQKFLEKKLEEKAQKAKDTEQRKEAKELISTLRKAYLQQLAESLKSEEVDNDEPADGEEQEVSEEADDPTTSSPVPEVPSPPPALPSLVTETTEFLPWISRFKREDPKTPGDTSTQNPLLNLNEDQLEQVKLLYSFMEEIKQFFTLVSALDEDTCLQKMVCDVFAQSVSGGKSPSITTYEANMISTFRIMDAIVPFDPSAPEDSSTKYRLAAKIGTVGASMDVCLRYYSACAYTSDQIINLGNQVAAATTQASPSEIQQPTSSPAPPSPSSPVFGTRIRTQRREHVDEEEEEQVTMPKV